MRGQLPINCPALNRKFMALLSMDDTTLFSSTKEGPRKELEVYVEFCRKMRMRLNTTKSKLMHFTKHSDKQGQ